MPRNELVVDENRWPSGAEPRGGNDKKRGRSGGGRTKKKKKVIHIKPRNWLRSGEKLFRGEWKLFYRIRVDADELFAFAFARILRYRDENISRTENRRLAGEIAPLSTECRGITAENKTVYIKR